MKIIGKVFILLAVVTLLVVPVVGCPGEQITSEEFDALVAKVDILVQQQLDTDTEIAALLAQVGALGQQLTWYEDSDGDGFGNPNVSQISGDQPEHYVADSSDCDDNNGDVNPGAPEIPVDGLDNDCNPTTSDSGH